MTVDEVAVGVDVDFGSVKVTAPVSVTFSGVPVGEAVFAVHVDDNGHWTPLESTRDGSTLTVATTEFSVITWVKTEVFRPVLDYVEEQLSGRSSPAECVNPPPWATVTPPPSGTLHACVRAAPDGSAAAELDLKSNRGSYQIIDLPAGSARNYVWVEDQPDVLRAVSRLFTHSDERVLLPPQKRMTLSYNQPEAPIQLLFNSDITYATILLSAVGWVIDFLAGKTNLASQLGPLYCSAIVHLDLKGATGTIDGTSVSGPALSRQMWECATDYIDIVKKHPDQAVANYSRLVGTPMPAKDAAKLAGSFKSVASKAATILQVLTLGGVAVQSLSMAFDSLLGAISADTVAAATLTLNGLPEDDSGACPSAATLNSVLADSGKGDSGDYVEDPVVCDGPWAILTMVNGSDGVGSVAFHHINGEWVLIYAADSISVFCETVANAGYQGDAGCGTPNPIDRQTTPPAPVLTTANRILAAARAGDYEDLARLAAAAGPDFQFTVGDPAGEPVDYWRSRPGSLPAMISALSQPAAVDGDRWVYPGAWMSGDLGDDVANGPRLAIASDGTWLFFVEGGD